MTTAEELLRPNFGQDDCDEYDVLEEFFPNALKRRFEQGIEQGIKQGIKQGRIIGIYDLVLNNFRHRFDEALSARLARKINVINYYPALEEIQQSVWSSSSPVAFERRVDSVVEKYAEEIKNANTNKE